MALQKHGSNHDVVKEIMRTLRQTSAELRGTPGPPPKPFIPRAQTLPKQHKVCRTGSDRGAWSCARAKVKTRAPSSAPRTPSAQNPRGG